MSKQYSGFTATSAESLLLDSGAFFVNFDVEVDDFDSAIAGGKLLGATRGGGQFSAVPEMRTIEIDGVKGRAKGLQVIDSWEVNITANVLEVTLEGLSRSLTASEVDTSTYTIYDMLKAKNAIALSDYIDNITWIGKLSGSEEPVIIQVYNALNTTGLTLQTQDKNEAVIAMDFVGSYDSSELDSPPFAIFYPKTDDVRTTVAGVVSDGAVVAGANVTLVMGNGVRTATTNASGEYTLLKVLPGTYTVTATDGTQVGAVTGVVVVASTPKTGVDITIA